MAQLNMTEVGSRHSLTTPLPLAAQQFSQLNYLNGRKRKHSAMPFEEPDEIYKLKRTKRN
jgi:hypothetical protein